MKKLEFACCQSRRRKSGPSARLTATATGSTRSASAAITSSFVTPSFNWKNTCAASSGMKMKLLSYSDIPTSKMAATLNAFARGMVPNGVLVPRGAISVTFCPTATPNRRANRLPTINESLPSNSTRLPCWMLVASSARAWKSRARSPRTSAPAATPFADAITCPSTSGVTVTTPSTLRSLSATASKSLRLRSNPVTSRWPLMPRMRPRSSARKPFITDMTMISVATPSMIPSSENQATTEMKPS